LERQIDRLFQRHPVGLRLQRWNILVASSRSPAQIAVDPLQLASTAGRQTDPLSHRMMAR
jgi:hypothetical protein